MDIIARLTRRRGMHTPPLRCSEPVKPLPACGWFESTHELHSGLSITEYENPDAVANALPLDAWLNLHLAREAVCA